MQNSAARIVTNTSSYTSITPVLKKFHWLPVEQSTVFKTAILVYKFLHTGFSRYLSSYSSTSLFINLSNSLVIVLLLMLPLFGMLWWVVMLMGGFSGTHTNLNG